MLSCFPCFDVTQCLAPLCVSYASGRDVSGEFIYFNNLNNHFTIKYFNKILKNINIKILNILTKYLMQKKTTAYSCLQLTHIIVLNTTDTL
jgi:hypothetical protein